MNTHETPENIEILDPIKPKRKGGGQPGNKNAIKHGIYSSFIMLSDRSIIEGMTDGSLKDELALAQARLKNALDRAEAATVEAERTTWEAISHDWFESIVKIKTTAAEKLQQTDEIWETFMEAIRASNDRLGVK